MRRRFIGNNSCGLVMKSGSSLKVLNNTESHINVSRLARVEAHRE